MFDYNEFNFVVVMNFTPALRSSIRPHEYARVRLSLPIGAEVHNPTA
jgi:hypothetical protein